MVRRGLILGALLALTAVSGDASAAQLRGWGDWRGTITLKVDVTGRQDPLQDGSGGWNFNRSVSIAWNFNATAKGNDPYEVASGPATITVTRNDQGIPRAGFCDDETSATGSLTDSFRTMLEFSGSRQRGIQFYLHHSGLNLHYDVTHAYACIKPTDVFPEEWPEVVAAFYVKPVPFVLGTKTIRGTQVIETRCGNWTQVLRGIKCDIDDVDPWFTRKFTIAVKLTKVTP